MAGTRTMGTNLTMKRAGSETADTVIAHLTSIGEVTGEREEIDVTTFDSPNGAKEFISGVVDFGSFDVAGNVIDGVQVSTLYDVFNGQQNRNFEIQTPSGTVLALNGHLALAKRLLTASIHSRRPFVYLVRQLILLPE